MAWGAHAQKMCAGVDKVSEQGGERAYEVGLPTESADWPDGAGVSPPQLIGVSPTGLDCVAGKTWLDNQK